MTTPSIPAAQAATAADSALRDVGAAVAVHTFTVAAVRPDVFDGSLHDNRPAILPVSEVPPSRTLRVGDKVLVTTMAALDKPVVSASSPDLVAALYAGVVPEVRSGAVRIVAVARIPGVRSKVAVASSVEGVDPVAALVGRDANRVSFVAAQLGGERIDVIPYAPDLASFAANAMAPAQVVAVSVEPSRVVIAVPDHQMSAAVGGGGLNSHLAGELIGMPIEVVQASALAPSASAPAF